MDLVTEVIQQEEQFQEIKYNLSDHAFERYAQRIMGYQNQTDIRRYVNQNRQTIIDRVNKICNYGELFYEGGLRDYPLNKIYVKDNWVVIVDPSKNLVVTLYKVDFGLEVENDGVDFNKLFLDKHKNKLAKAKSEFAKYKEEADVNIKEFQNFKKENDDEIKELNKRIKSLEEQNEGYNKLIKGYKDNVAYKQREITNIVENMVCRKKF